MGSEAEWVEFKRNNADPKIIGKNISALSNGGALHDRPFGYLIWGIDDDSHQVVGTDFSLEANGTGPQEPRIRASISDNCDFQFQAVDAGRLVIRDPEAGNRSRAYLPNWASPSRDQ